MTDFRHLGGRAALALAVALGAHAAALALAFAVEKAPVSPAVAVEVLPLLAAVAPSPPSPPSPPAPPSPVPRATGPTARPHARAKAESAADPVPAPPTESPPSAPVPLPTAAAPASAGAPGGGGPATAIAARSDGEGASGGAGGAAVPVATDASNDALRARIRDAIAAHKQYPELARRRRVEGTVAVRFRIAPDGSVRDLGVRRGVDPALDDAALAAVRDAAPLPVLDGALEIDLEFRLARPPFGRTLDAPAVEEP